MRLLNHYPEALSVVPYEFYSSAFKNLAYAI